MAKPDSKLRVGSKVKHPHFGEGKIKEFQHDGATAVIECVEKPKAGPPITHSHYAKTAELKRIEG
jgi:hypothetical protein